MQTHIFARALGGEVAGRDAVLCPGPGHSAHDRSLAVKFDPAAPDGFSPTAMLATIGRFVEILCARDLACRHGNRATSGNAPSHRRRFSSGT